MSTATRLSLDEAVFTAEKFRALFPADSYQRWEFAGSVRRRARDVGDLEHVIMPNFGDVPGADLFATPKRMNLVFARMDELLKAGTVTKHLYNGSPRWGERYRGADFFATSIANHEVFVADEANWGPTLAIRTGPAEFSQRLVTGLLRNGRRNKDGYVWECRPCPAGPNCAAACPLCQGKGLEPVERVSAPDERTYFGLCGVPWTEPEGRR